MPRTASLFPETQTSAAWVIAHCDGGARGNPGPAGYGAVLQDSSGHILGELSEFLGNRTNNFAEYSGLLGCLQWAFDHHHKHLRVVSDSELMVKQIQGRYKVNSPDLRPLWEEARRRIAQLDGFEITHALRHKNKHADRLANDAMDLGTGKKPGIPGLDSENRESEIRESAAPTSSKTTRINSPQTEMLRGFSRNGAIHLLGGASLPDGVFVKIIPE
jgi:ribonuclease HI